MANWHGNRCRKPDVVAIDTTLTCMSCDSFYSCDDNDNTTDRSELYKEASDSVESPAYLNLNWPSTVEFSSPDEVQDASIKDTLKRLDEMLDRQSAQHQDSRRRSTTDVSSTSSAITTHENSSQKVSFGAFVVLKAAESSQRKSTDGSSAMSLIYNSLTGAAEIRLLRLSPQNSADGLILHGYLESTSLSVRPDFTAVSYTWADSDGNRSLSEEIFLGDLWIPLPITRNCAAALRRLRSKDHSERFWVDSICINQTSTDEKSHQVGLMRDIFSQATSVMIFLGGDKDAQDARLLKRTSESLFYMDDRDEVTWDAVHDHLAVQALFDRPYWSRIWVIQEVLLSRKAAVILGETVIPLQSLLKARLVEPDGGRRKISVPPWLQLGGDLPVEDFHGLSRLLTETSSCLATDPKDKIFALLGLVQGAHLEGLVADYSKIYHEIRVGIAAYFLIRQGQINILKSAAFDQGLVPGLPSWVPYWDSHRHHGPKITDSFDQFCTSDLRRSAFIRNQEDMMRCYDILRPRGANATSFGHSRSSGSTFRVLNGTGALLIKAHGLVCINSVPFRDAFKYRSPANRSALITPSASIVPWGIYAARDRLDNDLEFGKPGDWIVEIPGLDDFYLLRQIPSLTGAYHISSICGLAIVMRDIDMWLLNGEVPRPHAGNAHIPPSYSSYELISRLVIFNLHQLQFLQDWEILVSSNATLGPSPGLPSPDNTEPSAPLSKEDMGEYMQWADCISVAPLRDTRAMAPEDAVQKVSEYLDRWQDLDLWDRIVSELEAVPWSNMLGALTEVKSGFLSILQSAKGEKIEIMHDNTSPPSGTISAVATELVDPLLQLTSREALLLPASMMDAFEPILRAVETADTTRIFEVFQAKEDEIEKNIEELESHLKFMRDSLPKSHTMRDHFAQRQLLKNLYWRSELREFLIY